MKLILLTVETDDGGLNRKQRRKGLVVAVIEGSIRHNRGCCGSGYRRERDRRRGRGWEVTREDIVNTTGKGGYRRESRHSKWRS